MNRLEAAAQLRRALMTFAAGAADQQAAEFPSLYPAWRAGETVAAGDRRCYLRTGALYRAIQAHTTQADWTPDVTPALWARLEVAHAGTADDPIPAALNIEYVAGRYYSEGDALYLCIRDSEIPLAYLPSQLLGNYFEEV